MELEEAAGGTIWKQGDYEEAITVAQMSVHNGSGESGGI